MKSLLSILSLSAGLFILPISSIAQEDTGNSGSGSDEVVPQWQKDFEVLGSAKQKAYRELSLIHI